MNPVNATALYISASRLVLNYDPGDPKAFTEINRLLPYFRQSLSCCVCGETPSIVPGRGGGGGRGDAPGREGGRPRVRNSPGDFLPRGFRFVQRPQCFQTA